MTRRLNITVPADLLARIDEAAAREHLTRSGFLRAAALERLAGESPSDEVDHVAEEGVAYAPRPQLAAGGSSAHGRRAAAARLPASRVAELLAAFFSARDDVVAAYLFGSVARGDASGSSDVDVAVLLADELDAGERWSTHSDLTGRIGAVLGTNDVDVVVLNDAPVSVAHGAIVEGIAVAGVHRAGRSRFEEQVRGRYEASLPSARARDKALAERIASGGFFAG